MLNAQLLYDKDAKENAMSNEAKCNSYIDHLVAEHRRLHAMLREMQSAINHSVEREEESSFARVIRILTKLQAELHQHFGEEETGCCLEEAVCRCPRLSSDAMKIED